ncbi:redoxin domain-containing protein [Piscinibacter sp. HJYY11]|uniref:redoxin domain-containing protein n=1 Tax=Piscinibacter sp. HJYY11 TaxID=2801333 RepID=UPI00191E709A|nr:redoxin domain-containing protein [Piscinibacter sp. HJYY11]MBL0726526.1 redoxin domain-containing protein [Piscinibacter sp. HJYY11]
MTHFRRQCLLALATAWAFVPFAAHAVATLDQPAPAFTVQGADGKPVSLSAYKGKTVVLEWTNHECPFVRKHYDQSGNIPKLQKEATANGVVWLQVISSYPGSQGHVSGPEALKLNQQRGAAPTAVLLDSDGKVGKAYEARTTPHLYVINAAGNLVYKGGIDSIPSSNASDIPKADNYVKLALADVAANRKVAQANTRPYGCSVKYGD